MFSFVHDHRVRTARPHREVAERYSTRPHICAQRTGRSSFAALVRDADTGATRRSNTHGAHVGLGRLCVLIVVALIAAGCGDSTRADTDDRTTSSVGGALVAPATVDGVPVLVSAEMLIVDDPARFVSADDGDVVVGGRVVVVTEAQGEEAVEVIGDAAARTGGVVVGASSRLGVFQLDYPNSADDWLLSEQVDALNAVAGVVAAGVPRAHRDLRLQGPPDDAADPLWGDRDVVWPFELLGLDDLWADGVDMSANDVGVLIADWGILDDHPDLGFAAPVRSPFDDAPEQRLLWDITQSSHGTAIAGVACGLHDGQGSFGVANGCALYGIDLLFDLVAGYDEQLTTAMTLAVMTDQMLRDHDDIKVVNASWGFGPNPAGGCDDPADPIDVWVLYRLMIQHPDVLFVTSAGNCSIDVPVVDSAYDLSTRPVQFPAGAAALLDNVIAVTAVNQDLSLPDYANAGPAVTVAAPGGMSASGTHIWAPTFSCDAGSCDPTYSQLQGTSLASPWVSGLAALMFQANPDLTAAQAKACIATTAATPIVGNQTGTTVTGINLASPTLAVECANAEATPDGPVPLEDCVDFTDAFIRETVPGAEDIPAPLWVCTNPVEGLDCPDDLASKVAARYPDRPDLQDQINMATWCHGDLTKYIPTTAPSSNDSEPTPAPVPKMVTLDGFDQWAEQYWTDPPIPVQVTNLSAEGKPVFAHLRSVPVVDGMQLLMVRSLFDGSNKITIVSITEARENEDTRLYTPDELPQTTRIEFYPNAGEITFNPDPNIKDCGACQPATAADLDRLNAFLQALQQP